MAQKQLINRSVGQYRRQNKIKMAVKAARDLVLSIAYHEGAFICSRDLSRVSQEAGWGCLTGFDSTGRAMRDIIDPLEKEGLFIELRTVEGDWALIKEWGRIGSPGTVREEWFDDESQAINKAIVIVKRRLKNGYQRVN